MQPGDRVKVMSGRHKGETGVIVHPYSPEGYKWLENAELGRWWEVRLGDGMRHWIEETDLTPE